MFLRFIPRHTKRIDLEFERPVMREAIVKTLGDLGWRYESPRPDLYIAKVRMNGMSWGERVTISMDGGELEVKSGCYPVPQLIDWGKNRKNVDTFIALLSAKAATIAKFRDANDKPDFDTSLFTPLERVLQD
jgi:hypothetical protein